METKISKLASELVETSNEERRNVLTEFFSAYNQLSEDKKAFVNACLQKGGHTFVACETETDKMGSLNKDAKKIINSAICHTRMVASINKIYENAVNNEKERETLTRDFMQKERNWGKRVSTEFVVHKGQIYVTLFPQKSESEYFVNGQKTDFATWESYLQPSKTSAYQKAKAQENQGVEKPVIYRDFALNSIKSISIRGNEIELK